MKVKLGKPHYHYSTHNWKTPEWFSSVAQSVINTCWNSWWVKCETEKVRIDPWDTWSVDCTLNHIILPLLKQYRIRTHGAPLVADEDVPDDLKRPSNLDTFDTDDAWFKRWDYVLDEMIWAFQELQDDEWESKYFFGDPDFINVPLDEKGNEITDGSEPSMWRLDHGANDTSKFDKEGYEAHNARISNGTRLFGKYYRNLWD